MELKPKVGVIGAGAGGILMAIQLADAGYDFTIFDRADSFGGTWRHNTLPVAACDVPSHLYSYSFAPNPRWSKTYANQPETAVTMVRWSAEQRRWRLTTERGDEYDFDIVVSAVGTRTMIPGDHRLRR